MPELNEVEGSQLAPDYFHKLTIESCLMGSNWCIRCYPEKVYAQFIWKGHSLCEECFKIYESNRKEFGWYKPNHRELSGEY